MRKRMLVTGSSGLIGSEVVECFSRLGWAVHGVDNNMRAEFFGPQADTRWNLLRLQGACPGFQHHELDIRDRPRVQRLLQEVVPQVIVHAAGQPSHDLAAQRPFDDFDVNAAGTLNVLEAVRQACPESPFVYMSTNKVYGDRPNTIRLQELATRWDYADPMYADGIAEDFPVDQSQHSIFGVSKLAGDMMVQEYGRYFGMLTCVLRGGCFTGPHHCGVELHGFLSYLIRCNLEERPYRIFGYKGKQVRDNIHSYDVVEFVRRFIENPREGEVYNIGGGRLNSISVLEAFALIESISGKRMQYEYMNENRKGDHICYISDLRKMQAHYPGWSITRDLPATFVEIYESWMTRV